MSPRLGISRATPTEIREMASPHDAGVSDTIIIDSDTDVDSEALNVLMPQCNTKLEIVLSRFVIYNNLYPN